MGLPSEQSWREAEDGGGKRPAVDAGSSRTPDNGRRAKGGDCPAAPRKRAGAPAGGVGDQQQRSKGYYTGDDLEAFFVANNV